MKKKFNKRDTIIAALSGSIISSTITKQIGLISDIWSTMKGIFEIAINICKANLTIDPKISKSMNAITAITVITAITASSILLIPKKDSLRKERSKWEIIQDMLKVLTEDKKPKKTRIMQRACLDWRNFQRYFNFLLEEKFITECDNPGDGRYELTNSGYELLKRLKNVDEILNSQTQEF